MGKLTGLQVNMGKHIIIQKIMGQGADMEKKSNDYQSVISEDAEYVWNTYLQGGPHCALGNMKTSPALAVHSGSTWVKTEK